MESPELTEVGNSRKGSSVTVKPVANAIRILRHLSQSGAPERSVDIARRLSINPSTCFNILRTLAMEDVIDFNPMSKRYSAGLGLARLVGQLVTQGQRVQLVKPLLQEFAARMQVTITLWRRMGEDRIVIVSSAASPADVRIDMAEGQRFPMLMGASGRLFSTQLDLDTPAFEDIYHRIRWARHLPIETYREEVHLAAERGWAVDDGYFSVGIQAVAAPVYSPEGAIDFTVSAVMFRGQRDDEGVGELAAELIEFCTSLAGILF
ncbi:helix-turn-helix domain-containing protein [Pseudomonas sp. R3.Fl]|jgi:DNA-binding IclR family transcriptional regulator|uniref:IclR family transcriptional regulator n=1 Tax=Pseudomonas TaxID=286 RepID=UPI000730B0DA|nr:MULTISPECIES: IclR family transcriptional regulator C-terminal domain-containing protein [Pseudomonas]KSW22891.1 IclR family transcriptional regulator [Pseudomonas sp. ADP]AMO77643.1 HTH-type transcriptional repressor AllR [Pseudomonas citronellolis]MCL6692158.1 helix-turn-helix domain-containing protein [Pseudomonas sp. R3.Fl]MDN6875775.1 IclR family transcriptional regulator C-terminal domain-containing protein [Pseudomonas citronellolis]OBP09199.1 IclR family transcriptional regulator [P